MAPQNRPPPRRADTLLVAADSQSVQDTAQNNDELFLDPMLGTPLAIYIEKDVHDRDNLVEIITVRHIHLLTFSHRQCLTPSCRNMVGLYPQDIVVFPIS